MNALMSIKPKYVKEILNKNKKFEYRKKIFKKDVEKIYIYSTSPQKEIVGYFKYSGYLKGTPLEIWNLTNDVAGIDEKSYFKYFENKEFAYAIKIEKLYIFKKPIDPKSKIDGFISPQSYMYLRSDLD